MPIRETVGRVACGSCHDLPLEGSLREPALGKAGLVAVRCPHGRGLSPSAPGPPPRASGPGQSLRVAPLTGLCFTVWEHGPRGAAGARGGEEVSGRGAVSGLRGEWSCDGWLFSALPTCRSSPPAAPRSSCSCHPPVTSEHSQVHSCPRPFHLLSECTELSFRLSLRGPLPHSLWLSAQMPPPLRSPPGLPI